MVKEKIDVERINKLLKWKEEREKDRDYSARHWSQAQHQPPP